MPLPLIGWRHAGEDMLVVKIYPSLVHMVVIFCLARGKRGSGEDFLSISCVLARFNVPRYLTGHAGGDGVGRGVLVLVLFGVNWESVIWGRMFCYS